MQCAITQKKQEVKKKTPRKHWLYDLFKVPRKPIFKTNKSHLPVNVRKALHITRGTTKKKYQIVINRQNTKKLSDERLHSSLVIRKADSLTTKTSLDFRKSFSRNIMRIGSQECAKRSLGTPKITNEHQNVPQM